MRPLSQRSFLSEDKFDIADACLSSHISRRHRRQLPPVRKKKAEPPVPPIYNERQKVSTEPVSQVKGVTLTPRHLHQRLSPSEQKLYLLELKTIQKYILDIESGLMQCRLYRETPEFQTQVDILKNLTEQWYALNLTKGENE